MRKLSNKEKALLLLHKGKTNHEVAEELNLTYTTVVGYEKYYEESKLNGELDKILSSDINVVTEIASNLELQSSNAFKGLQGLDRLNMNLQASAELIILKLNMITNSVGPDDVADLATCSKILCEMQNAFFNKNSIQLNVQNNNFDSTESTYGEFLSDKPPIN